jgi:hypothetical protein
MATSRGRVPAGPDKELQAIGAIISLLEPLNEEERGRVLEYVLKRLDMATVRPAVVASEQLPSAAPSTPQTITDIRTLTAEKQPRSANEMAALVAYYVSELAPDADRSDTVNPDLIGQAAPVRHRHRAGGRGSCAERRGLHGNVGARLDEPPNGGRCSRSDRN